MARYSVFLGLQVEVQYRAGDILLPASGTFVGDTGRSIFLEQSLEQRGQHRYFRWEIPYQYIVRLAEKPEAGVLGYLLHRRNLLVLSQPGQKSLSPPAQTRIPKAWSRKNPPSTG
jgi:hypothetical protein